MIGTLKACSGVTSKDLRVLFYWLGILGHCYSARSLDLTDAYSVKLGDRWHSFRGFVELDDYIEWRSDHQTITRIRKSAIDAVKVHAPVDQFVGEEVKFDLEVL